VKTSKNFGSAWSAKKILGGCSKEGSESLSNCKKFRF